VPDERITPEQAESRFNSEITKAATIVDGVNPTTILKEQNEVAAGNLNKAINVAFAPFLGSMVGSV
jgi:hypothetical protein